MPIDSTGSGRPRASATASRSRRSASNTGRLQASDRRHGGGIVIRPSRRTFGTAAIARASASAASAVTPPLVVSPARFTAICSGLNRATALAELGRELDGLHGVHERDLAGDELGLVALQAADEMPAGRGEIAARGPLVDELLRVVLAEVGRTGRDGFEHRRRRMPLRHRDDRDVAGRAARALAGGVDARANLTPAIGDARRDG